MTKFPAGTVMWSVDPIEAHDERPVIILSHEKHPFGSIDVAVMCLGTGASDYDHYTPALTDDHLSGFSFSKTTYLMPWALYTIPPGTLKLERASGTLSETGERLVKKSLILLFDI